MNHTKLRAKLHAYGTAYALFRLSGRAPHVALYCTLRGLRAKKQSYALRA